MNTISISQLRNDAAAVLSQVSVNQQPTVILQRSKPQAVLVDYDYFQSLEEAALDASDAKEAELAAKEPKTSFRDYVEKRFGKQVP